MSPEQYRNLLNDVARTYNEPPRETPREEMWSRIRRAREGSLATHVAVPRETIWEKVSVARASAPTYRPSRSKVRIAPLSTAAGSSRGGSRPPFKRAWFIAPAVLAASLTLTVANITPDSPSPAPAGDQTMQIGEATIGWRNIQLPSAAGIAFTGVARDGADSWGILALDADPAFEAFKRAAIAHLRRSEAMITSFRSLGSDLATDRNTRASVRELLSQTRLLISSPISARTSYKLVFQDLELVLVKMSLVSRETLSMDRDQIEQALKSRNLLARMRELIPVPSSSNAN